LVSNSGFRIAEKSDKAFGIQCGPELTGFAGLLGRIADRIQELKALTE
jgi:hypothetical protein